MIIGHQKIRSALIKQRQSENIFQSYLFFGPESVGKFSIAKEFASMIVSDGKTQNAFEDNRYTPDLFVIEVGDEKSISVESVRSGIKWIAQFPYISKKKVLIIRDAHRLTETSQNALLKTLEEPPSYAVIILVTHDFGKILPTIVSRCQQIPFHLVPSSEIRKNSEFFNTALEYEFLFDLGRPGVLFQHTQKQDQASDFLEKLQQCMDIANSSTIKRLLLSEICSKNIPQTLEILLWWGGILYNQSVYLIESERIIIIQKIEKIEKLKKEIQQFPGSVRLLLDTFFLYW